MANLIERLLDRSVQKNKIKKNATIVYAQTTSLHFALVYVY
jgi:hypothetical protein